MDHSASAGGHGGMSMAHHAEMFRVLFWRSLLLAVPVVVCSAMIQNWLGYSLPDGLTVWVPPVFGSLLFAYGGRPFLSGAASELRARQPGMMTLITLAIVVAGVSSLAFSLGWGSLDYWWELASLIVVMLLGHWQEMKAVGSAQGALSALAELLPDHAERLEDGAPRDVPVAQLRPTDVVLVRPGGRVPADGTVVDGSAAMNESMITGESRPVPRGVDDRVVAGTVSTDGSLRVRVDAVGDDTTLAGIQRLVAYAQASQSRAQALADRAAAVLFYVATGSAVTTLVVWSGLGHFGDGVTRMVSVLVIACPHALGLAIPLVLSLATARAAQQGILIRDRRALERMRSVRTVLFDKTGTLTEGNFVVTDHVAIDGVEPDDLLRLAAAAESESEHPIAHAIRDAVKGAGDVPVASKVTSEAGVGVSAEVDGRAVAVGGPAMLERHGLTLPSTVAVAAKRWRERGGAVLSVVRDDAVIGAVTVADQVRPHARAAVEDLHRRGRSVAMITGDARQVADAVAADLGIDEVFAEVLPDDKDAKVRSVRDRGTVVAMVGDGVNDAPALARADVGLAIGAGTDVAIESAGMVLAADDPRLVSSAIVLSEATYRKEIQNLVWATAYNLVAIPVAAGVFAFAGVTMPPAVAAVAMSASTIIVAANAQLMRRVDLAPEDVVALHASSG